MTIGDKKSERLRVLCKKNHLFIACCVRVQYISCSSEMLSRKRVHFPKAYLADPSYFWTDTDLYP